jgi:hypothetical protein
MSEVSDQDEADRAAAQALGFETESTAADDAYARILLLGQAKTGKTTSIAMTAPKPVVINCDGKGATKGAKLEGAKFLTFDVEDSRTWEQAIIKTRAGVSKGLIQTVIVDTASLLADILFDEFSQKLEGFDLWREIEKRLVGGIKLLNKLDAHVFVLSHIDPGTKQENSAGQMPAIGGKSKFKIPAIMHDWILLELDPNATPQRRFVIGPQKNWNHSGRNIRRSTIIEATVPALFDELGIRL